MFWRKAIYTLTLLVVCILLLIVVNYVHFQYFPVDVVLYDALVDVVITGVLLAFFSAVVYRRILAPVLTGWEVGLTVVLGFAGGVLYALSIPTIIDRSLSVYILEKLAQRGGEIRYDAFQDVLEKEFMNEYQIVDIRLTEQINSGTVEIDRGCVRLTPRGQRIEGFTRWFRTYYLPKRREIMGQYTDVLTDPFRNSKKIVDTDCKR